MIQCIKARFEDEQKILEAGFSKETVQIVLEDDTRIGLLWGDYVFNNDKMYYLDLIISEIPFKGLGRKIINHIFETFNVDYIRGESTIDAKIFWLNLGANVDNYFIEEDREVFQFTLSKNNFKQSCLRKDIFIKEQLEYFAGSRDMSNTIYSLLKTYEEKLTGVFFRGMPFPKHRLKVGEIVEEWHGCSHWSIDKAVALNFAIININGYINEDYYQELSNELGEENVDFKQVLFIADNLKGVKLYEVLEKYNINNFIDEKEITTMDMDFVITSIKKDYINNEEIFIATVKIFDKNKNIS